MTVGFEQQILENSLKIRKHSYLPFSLHIFESIPSTNEMARDLLNQGAKSGCVVIATEQTAGRGQWGKKWLSPTGGLYLSVAIAPKLEVTNSYQLTLATAWGIASQLRNCGINVGIKWPNDLVLDGCKLGGILTETKVYQRKITQAVIGVGINWSNPVPATGINLTSWQTTHNSQLISCLEILAVKVLLGIESGLECLDNEGISILLSRYLDLLTNMGDHVYVNNLLGTVVGVSDQGNLLLKITESDHQETFVTTTREISLEPGTISLGYCKSSV